MLFALEVKKSETLIFSKASKALDCFSQRICRTLMAVAGLSPPCYYEATHQRPDCFERMDVMYGPWRLSRILWHCQMIWRFYSSYQLSSCCLKTIFE